MEGIKLIIKERNEQKTKHQISVRDDWVNYENDELIKMVNYCIRQDGDTSHQLPDMERFKEKIQSKSRVEQLTIAGALIAAEIDRLTFGQALEKREGE